MIQISLYSNREMLQGPQIHEKTTAKMQLQKCNNELKITFRNLQIHIMYPWEQ